MNRLFFELVGPFYDLARAEVIGALESLGYAHEVISYSKGVLALETDGPPTGIGGRLGLTHRIFKMLSISSLEDVLEGNISIDLPKGSAAVETRRVFGKKVDSEKVRENLGGIIKENHKIDLDEPDNRLYVLISDRCYLGLLEVKVDKDALKSREVKNRPFFSPISLEPRYARALINLARAEPNSRLHDPFCGTGGILIEGGTMGIEVSGGDIDSEMVEGSRENLDEFDVQGNLKVGDLEDTIPSDIDCIVTDPPYGRAASTSGESIEQLYNRLFLAAEKNLIQGGHLAVIFPEKKYCELGKDILSLKEHYVANVHSSLNRHFCVYEK